MLYALAIVAGVFAGVVNTLAGSGSAITLPVLVFLGLSPTAANATNRVGIFLASLIGARTFKKGGVLETHNLPWLIVPAVIGGGFGAWVATSMDNASMHWLIVGVMVFMLVLLLANPKRWIEEHEHPDTNHRRFTSALMLFGIGFYGGLIQAGVGVLLLGALVLKARYSLVKANAVKVVIVFCLTVPALLVFIYSGQIDWIIGLVMAIGQGVGAWLAATFAVNHPQANVWIRRLLIAMIIVMLAKLIFFSSPEDQAPRGRDGELIEQLGAELLDHELDAVEASLQAVGPVHVGGEELVLAVGEQGADDPIGVVALFTGEAAEIALQPDAHLDEAFEMLLRIPRRQPLRMREHRPVVAAQQPLEAAFDPFRPLLQPQVGQHDA